MPTSEPVRVELSNDEALILLAFLARINKEHRPALFEDQAEQRVLWDIEALLERQLVEPFAQDYDRHLREARDRVRDRR